jgi:hypothetical protein
MKQTFFILGAALLFSCNNGTQNAESTNASDSTHVCCSDTLTCCMDTTEKHFPCVVEKCEKEGPGDWSVYTECGLCVHCSTECKVGDTLNIESPKHD